MNLTLRHPDSEILRLWVRSKTAENTRQAYLRDAIPFLERVGSLRTLTLGDLQDYAESLEGSTSTIARKVKTIKSLLSFAASVQYTPFNVGAALKAPPVKDTLAQRILDEETVIRIITHEPDVRNQTILKLLYIGGLRVSEVCGITWDDLTERADGGQLTVFGKGGKTRQVLVPASLFDDLLQLPRTAERVVPLSRSQVHRIVQLAARRVGIKKNVSPHWFRHAHASHALDNGATVEEVAETLGHSSVAVTSVYLHARPDRSSALHIKDALCEGREGV